MSAETEPQPNVLFILADDLGWRDLSCQGSDYYESPNLDALAASGITFSQGYATCQVCSPSRASIFTGTYPVRHGITDWIGAKTGTDWNRNDRVLPSPYQPHLRLEEYTMAEAFRDAGYQTFFAGKWHLGGEGSFPEQHGFEINVGGHHAGSPPGGFFAPYTNPEMESGPDGESLPIRLGKETAAFIDRSVKDNKPFFAFLSFYSVHGPIQTTKPLWQKYRDKAAEFGVSEDRFVIDRTLPVRQTQDCPIYAGMIESMDDAVGLVMEQLKASGVADDTIVVFTSDNGGVSSGDAFSTSNLPLRGGKGRQWEGGIREPIFIAAPSRIQPGSTSNVPVIATDFYPTLMQMTGLPPRPEQHVDGVSLTPLFDGKSIAQRPLFWHYPHYGNQGGEPSSIIRQGDWKLIHYHDDGRVELYNLMNDRRELNNIFDSNIDLAEQLFGELQSFLVSTDAKIPEPDARFDSIKKTKQKFEIVNKKLPKLKRQHARFLEADYQPNRDWWGSAAMKPTVD